MRLNITYIMRRCRYGKTEGGKDAERRLGRRRIPYRPETDVTFSVDLTDRFFPGDENFFPKKEKSSTVPPLSRMSSDAGRAFSV